MKKYSNHHKQLILIKFNIRLIHMLDSSILTFDELILRKLLYDGELLEMFFSLHFIEKYGNKNKILIRYEKNNKLRKKITETINKKIDIYG